MAATPENDGGAWRFRDTRHLFGDADHLTIVAALFEEILGMGFLKVVGADFGAGYVRGDGKDGNTAAMAVEEAVDEMQVAGTAACGADGERAGKMRVGAGGECGDFFVAHVDPLQGAVSAQRVGKAVERRERAFGGVAELDCDSQRGRRRIDIPNCHVHEWQNEAVVVHRLIGG